MIAPISKTLQGLLDWPKKAWLKHSQPHCGSGPASPDWADRRHSGQSFGERPALANLLRAARRSSWAPGPHRQISEMATSRQLGWAKAGAFTDTCLWSVSKSRSMSACCRQY